MKEPENILIQNIENEIINLVNVSDRIELGGYVDHLFEDGRLQAAGISPITLMIAASKLFCYSATLDRLGNTNSTL